MSFTFESLIVAIIAILPGFVSSAVRATLRPGHRPSAGEWVAGSIVASLVMNALAFVLFIFFSGAIELALALEDMHAQFAALPGWTALGYVGVLYVLALLWGLVSALASERYAPSVLAYRLRLTPVSPSTNVFIDVLEQLIGGAENRQLRGKPNQQVAWLRVRRDSKVIHGRIRKSSVRFSVNEPIEVHLQPAYIFEGGIAIQRPDRAPDADQQRGIYLRVRPEDIVEIMITPASWTPLAAEGEAQAQLAPPKR
jgi:hypothetical protein